ncbi:hypothetical protein [Bacillus infantis]|uniref:hypothetical protein n=1 Tax=Bacillus infantis TaxID=324767 RepID=UPI0021550502|nr:hypothetical protein [Bacillus infantis]MCR6610061.1 hypothetical protein [Bacillus infantis]
MDTDSREEKEHSELDGFSRFMFGPRQRMQDESMANDAPEGQGQSMRPSGDWILGGPERKPATGREDAREPGQIEKILDGVDLGELMDNIDTLMTSAGQLKPLFKKVTPLFQQLLKKGQ